MKKDIFRLVLMNDALSFLRSLPEEVRDKIVYNFLRNCRIRKYGNSVLFIIKQHTVYLLFGIKRRKS